MKKSFEELQDEALIGEGGNICDISIDKLRSPTMKKLHKSTCLSPEKDTGMRRAAIQDYKKTKKGIPHFFKKSRNYKAWQEGYQEISNLVDITQDVMTKMIKAMKKDDFKSVNKLYKELGNIIK